MKAITVRQPWASLIVSGPKEIETRSWRTHHRGQLAIHAAAGGVRLQTIGAWRTFRTMEPGPDGTVRGWTAERYGLGPRGHGHELMPLPTGAVIGHAVLIDVCPIVVTARSPYDVPDPVAMVVETFAEPDGVHVGQRLWHKVGDSVANMTDQLPYGDYTHGRWAWMLDRRVPCTPVTVTGRLGLWDLP